MSILFHSMLTPKFKKCQTDIWRHKLDNKTYDIKIAKFTYHITLYLMCLNECLIFNPEYNNEEQSQQKSNNGNDEFKDADISDILLWAIFANRKDIAEICWLRGDNHLRNFFFLQI